MKKNLILCGILFCCVLHAFAQDKTFTLRLKWWNQFQFAGYYAAQLKGYYAEEGLKINIITGDAVHPVSTEVLEGRADFGISGSDLLVEYSKGKPLVALGAVFQHSPYVVMSLEEKKIQTPSDLIGKTIMASENQGWVELKAMLLEEGTDLNKINVINHSWNNLDLVNGKVDAMTAYRSVEVYQLQSMGVKPVYIQPVNYGIDFYGDVLFTRKQLIEEYPQSIEKFRRASFKGWEYAMSHKKELIDYIMSMPDVQQRKVPRSALEAEAAAMDQLVLPQIVEPGHMNAGRWEHIIAVHRKLGLIDKKVSVDDFLYKPKISVITQLRSLSGYVLGAIGLLFLLILGYSYAVSRAVKKRTAQLEKEMRERQIIQSALKENEAKLQKIMNESPDIICTLNNTGVFSEVGGATFEVLGYTPEEMCGRSYREFIHPDDIALTHTIGQSVVKGHRLFNFENRYLHKNGSIVYLSWSSRWDEAEEIMYSAARDVSSQKLTEQKYTTLVEHASDAIVIGDKTTKFIEANTAALKLFGYTREEFLQLTIFDILLIKPGEQPPQVKALLEGQTIRNERTAKRKDGSSFFIELSSKMLPDGNILGVARDITEQKANEQRLKESEEQLNLIYNKVADNIFVLEVSDGKYKVISVNQSFLDTTGLKREQVVGKYVEEVIPEPSRSLVLRKYKEAIQTKQTVQWEEHTRYPTGVKIGIVSITPVFDVNENCTQIIGSVHDITETKYVQSELIKMNERYEYVTNATFDAIWDWDLKTNEMYWGANFEKLFGHQLAEQRISINYSFENIHIDDKQRILFELNELVKGKDTNWEAEYRYRKADGSFAFVRDKAVVLREEDGTAYRIIGAMHDISKQKEEELRLSALEEEKEKRAEERELLINELSKNNKELKQFSFITSHNLRAPLTNLLAIADLIDTSRINDKGTKDLIEGFKSSTQKLNETLNDLIKVLVIKESSNQALTEIRFSEVYKQIHDSIVSIIKNSKARIVTDFSACDSLFYNRLYMESIFLNMITNSIKYSHPQRDPEIEIKSEVHGDEIFLSFTDNGIGLDMNTAKERLFGLYQRFHDHPDSKGIGLYLVHSQVTSLGGRIETESEVGKGTTFKIVFKRS